MTRRYPNLGHYPKIFLPNAEAETTQSKRLYEDVGLNDAKIRTIRTLTPQREYLVTAPAYTRVMSLGLGPAALSFVGATGVEDLQWIRQLVQTYGALWPPVWLRQRDCAHEAQWWEREHDRRQGKEHPHETLFARDSAAAALSHGREGAVRVWER